MSSKSKKSLILLGSALLLGLSLHTPPAHADDLTGRRLDRKGDLIDRALDRKGRQIDRAFDRLALRAALRGDFGLAYRLDKRGDRIERFLDRKGDRINRRLDRRSDRRYFRHHRR